MVQEYNVTAYFVVSNHKYAKMVIPQLLAQKCIDSLILLTHAEDSYSKGYLQTVAVEQGSRVEVVSLKNKSLDSSLTEYFKSIQPDKDTAYMYFGDRTCFIAPDCVYELAKFTIENPEYELVYPAAVNTERTTYIFQVTKHLEPKLLWRWDKEYIDEFSFQNSRPDFHIDVHERFLEEANKGLSNFSFGRYQLSESEMIPKHGFSMLGDTLAAHFKARVSFFQPGRKPVFSAIAGNALCSWFTDDKHKTALESTDLLSQYQKLGASVYSADNVNTSKSEYSDDISEVDMGLPLGAMFATNKNEFNIKFAISSHVSTQHKTLPILLKSMLEAQISEENILVVIGGAPKEYIERKNGILHSYVTHNSFDHNAIIDIAEKGWGGEWWFIMHDTTKAGTKFQEKLLSFGPKANHIAALKEGWLNMGLFSRKAIVDMRGYILQLKNCNKMQAILSEKMYTRLTDSVYYDVVEQINFPYYGDIYGDGVDRQVMHLPTIDLYKFQSFHYHSETTKKLIEEWMVK